LADNPNGTLAFRDELVSLLKTLDREEHIAAREFFLTAWNGTSGYTFDRIMRGKTHIEAACLSLLGRFLDQWGKLADSFGWSPGDLFDVPRDGAMGLAWWLKGRTVTALGPEHAGVGEPAYDRVTRREWVNPCRRGMKSSPRRDCSSGFRRCCARFSVT
jgi:hypothetical protein